MRLTSDDPLQADGRDALRPGHQASDDEFIETEQRRAWEL